MPRARSFLLVPAVLTAAVALSGCFYSRHQLSSDFGRAERQIAQDTKLEIDPTQA